MLIFTNTGGVICLNNSVHAPSAIVQWIANPLRKMARNSVPSPALLLIQTAQQVAVIIAVAVTNRRATSP